MCTASPFPVRRSSSSASTATSPGRSPTPAPTSLDFYTEQVDDSLRPTTVMLDGALMPVTSRVEIYRDAARQAPSRPTRCTSRNAARCGRPPAAGSRMRWTVLESGAETGRVAQGAARDERRRVAGSDGRDFMAPAQNILAADRAGHIAIRSTGRYPGARRRRAGRRHSRRQPSAGTTGAVTFRSMTIRRPSIRRRATSRQRISNRSIHRPHRTGGAAAYDPWRALRINELLAVGLLGDGGRHARVPDRPGQCARRSVRAGHILAGARNALRAGTAADRDKLARAVALLAEWDRRYTKDNRRAVLFEETMGEIVNRTWDELLPDSAGATRRLATPPSAVLARLMTDSRARGGTIVARRGANRGTISSPRPLSLHSIASRRGAGNRRPAAGDGIRFASRTSATSFVFPRCPPATCRSRADRVHSRRRRARAVMARAGGWWSISVPRFRHGRPTPAGSPAIRSARDTRTGSRSGRAERPEEIRFPRAAAAIPADQRKSSLTLRPRR